MEATGQQSTKASIWELQRALTRHRKTRATHCRSMPFSSLLLLATTRIASTDEPLEYIYSCLLPRAAALSLFASALLLSRATAVAAKKSARLSVLQRFGRKSLLITGCSFLFAASCMYRALNVADEGAFLCRGPKTLFNVPAAGRAVATVGELALVVQFASYLGDTGRRLGVRRLLSPSYTLAPAVIGECCSWLGVLTGTSRFFCAEYLFWVLIACMWAWDAAELLHRSARRGDALVHAALVAASLGLVAFNLAHELPHFFTAVPLNAVDGAAPARPTPFSCTQDADSPIWHERLPFFVTYFFGASTLSTALAARYHLRGGSAATSRPASRA